jgi:Flp pilus assembly protein TadG
MVKFMNPTTPNTPKNNAYRNAHAVEKAQTMVEFALILPLLLFIIFGLIEFGRLLATYSMVTTSSRDAARYGAAAGDVGGGVPHYLDCAGIRAAARKNAILANIPDANITISYDTGPGTAKIATSCPAPSQLTLGSRIVINVATTFDPIVPLGGLLKTFTINSSTVRTILTNVEIEGTPAAASGFPQVFFSTAAATVDENTGNYTLQVKMSISSSAETYVPFSVSGTAKYCDDFSVSANSLNNVCAGPVTGDFHIPAGQTTANVVIAISNDSIDEYDETVVLTLGKPTNATLGSPTTFTLTIVDDDGEPTVRFAANSNSDTEAIGSMPVKVSLTSISGKDVIVPFFVDDNENSALSNADYTLPGSSVTIKAGDLEAIFMVPIVDDILDEDDEGFIIHLSMPTNAVKGYPESHTITIVDNDTPPVVNFDVETQSVGESMGTANVTLKLSAPSSKDVNVAFSLTGSTAVKGQNADYTLYPETSITILAGETSADILVMLVADDIAELNETVIFTMGTVTNATKGTRLIHTLTILGITTQPVVSFQSAASGPHVEGTVTSFTARVVMSNLWNLAVSVPFSVDSTSTATQGQDFTISTISPLSIPAGQTYADITVTVLDDTLDEDDIENLVLKLGTPTNGTLDPVNFKHTAQLQDNDLLPVATIAVNVAYSLSGSESLATVKMDASLSNPSAKTVTIPFTVGGTATQGVDYSFTPASPLSIAPGATTANIVITVVDDSIYGEPNESVTFSLGTPTNASLPQGGSAATYTIEENDKCPSLGTLPTPTDGQLDVTLSNPANINVMITSIKIFWYDVPGEIALSEIDLGNSKMWTAGAASSPATITSGWANPDAKRTLDKNTTKTMSFVFSLPRGTSALPTNPSDYITVTFDNGCTVSVSRTH